MDSSYDEIISENPFYVELKNEFTNLYQHCITQSWVICIPRIGSLTSRVFTVEEFCAHILIPSDELPETHYTTLTEKQVTVVNKVITLDVNNSGLPLQSHILFEETFYTDDFIKYKVWCVETPLEPAVIKANKVFNNDYLITINDCIDLLWTQSAGRHVLEQIEACVKAFLKKNTSLPTAIGPLKDLISELYTQCLQFAFQNRRLREKSKTCKQMMENIKIAVESYMQHLLFDQIFQPICTCAAYEDARLNKTIRNLADIQLRDLDIRKDLYTNVPKAKQILSKINSYSTILEKVICIKNALNAISKSDKHDKNLLLTADDLLPVFVFLIIKSGLPHWYSQLTYIKEFRFSIATKGEGDETAFLVTTLEAVIEHIRSGALVGSPNPESYYYESDLTEENLGTKERRNSTTESISTSTSNSEETLEHVFELIKASHVEQVKAIFEKNQKYLEEACTDTDGLLDLVNNLDDLIDNDEYDEEPPDLCHPLCYCKKCCRTISKRMLRTSPTIASRDSHGLTALHFACIHGKANIVELLLAMHSEVDASDLNECTPLHHAASRGHQNALLLIIHSGANINKTNIDKNTPLHMAANNGHLNCVKALIYFAEHSKTKLKINSVNQHGDTPLHLASKWGYGGIAKALIENGAEPSLQNKKNKSAFDYAHNLRILQVLKSSTPNLYEYIHITNSNVFDVKEVTTPIQNKTKTGHHNDIPKSIENIKRIERTLKAISFGDIKLACFYMNINYADYINQNNLNSNLTHCHPLCECKICKGKGKCSTADFDINFSDTNGHTALHFAARYGLNDLCNILLENKADINSISKNGETALHLAALHNKISTIKFLLSKGSDVNATDIIGNTPLHNASNMGNIGAVKVLLNHKPDVLILNGLEKTALDVAKEKVHLTIIDLIDKHVKSLLL